MVLSLGSTAFACWEDIPLSQVIEKSHVVVIGEITRISRSGLPSDPEEYLYDLAFIQVQEVLFNTLKNQALSKGEEIPLSMPSSENRMQISTDLRYKVRQKGIWILEFQNGMYWATYPKDFQPMSVEQDVREILRKLSLAL